MIRSRFRRHRTDVLLAAAVLCLAAPVVQLLGAYQAPRYAMTAAIWDHHTIRIDAYAHTLGVDWAERDGHLYSHQAPAQQVLAVPAYAAYRAAGGEPAEHFRVRGNLGLWAVSMATAAVPAAALALMMRRVALRAVPDPVATASALALSFGTLLLPLSTVLFAHTLAAALGTGAALLLSRERPSAAAVAAAGALAAAAVTAEYPMAILVLVLTGLVVARHRQRIGWWVLGGLPPAVLLGVYHWAAFGHPLSTSYDHARGYGQTTGIGGVRWPNPVRLVDVLLGERGLFLFTPVVAVAVAGTVVLLRGDRRQAVRRAAVLAAAVFAAFVLLQAGWPNSTGGDSPGPRYATPALPLLAAGLAAGLRRWPTLARGATAFSVAVMGLATVTDPLAVADGSSALRAWVGAAADGDWTVTVPGLALGDVALLGLVAGAALLARSALASAASAARAVRADGADAVPVAAVAAPA